MSMGSREIVKNTYEQSSLEQEVGQVSDRLVRLILGDTRFKFFNDRVLRVEFHRLLASHVRGHCSASVLNQEE